MINFNTDLVSSSKSPSIQVAGEFFSRYLKISKMEATIHVAPIPRKKGQDKSDHTLGLTKQVDKHNFLLFMDFNRPLYEVLRTFAHEMVHVSQFLRGHLQCKMRHGREVLLWRGQKQYDSFSYLNRPWEKLAFSKQELMVRHLIECLTEFSEKTK